MVSCVIAALAAWFALPQPEVFWPLPPLSPGNIVARMPDVPRRAIGWGLGQLVGDGMPLGRVRWLLGEHQPHMRPRPNWGLVGGVLITRFDYADYGLSVAFLSDQDRVLRVSGVYRTPNRSPLRP